MRELRLVLLGLAAIIALLLGGAFLTRAFKAPTVSSGAAGGDANAVAAIQPSPASETASPSPTLSPEALGAARTAVERAIADAPDYARYFDRLRLVFPSDHDAIVTGIAERTSGRDVNVDVVMAEAVAALRKAHGTLAAKSTDEALALLYAMQLKAMQALGQSDPHLCVALLNGANVAGFTSFSADHRALVADSAIATLDAMHSGRTDHVERAPPSDADFKTLDGALVARGVTRPQIETLLDDTAASPPIPDDAMCEAGQTYLAVLAALPPDLRARLYEFSVDLMARS